MKILHFYKTYFPDSYGGVEQVIYQLAAGSVQQGIEAEVLSLSKNGEKTGFFDNHRTHTAYLDFQLASTGFSISVFRKFAELAAGADIIHYHYPWPFMDMVHFITQVKKPTVLTYHSDIIRQQFLLKFYRPLKKRFLKSVNCIVATSPNYFKTSHVLENYRDKTVVIPIGLNKASYPTPSAAILEKWRAKVGEKFFLFIGMIRYYKGLHILLEAAQGTRFPIVIVGAGPLEAQLKKQARELGLNNIHFLGVLLEEDKTALLQLCYAVVFPSHLRSEAFGVSLLEGAMFGKPMISSEIGTGTSYVNLHNETGVVIPPSNVQALRTALQFLWDNPDTAAEMGRQAQKRYEAFFTADKMVESYIKLYERLYNAKSYKLFQI